MDDGTADGPSGGLLRRGGLFVALVLGLLLSLASGPSSTARAALAPGDGGGIGAAGKPRGDDGAAVLTNKTRGDVRPLDQASPASAVVPARAADLPGFAADRPASLTAVTSAPSAVPGGMRARAPPHGQA